MISSKRALDIILSSFNKNRRGKVQLSDAIGYVLSQDIVSKDNLPRFSNAAMDGYALNSNYVNRLNDKKLKIVGEIYPSMNVDKLCIRKGECFYITTGSPLPKTCNAVIPIEEVEVRDGYIYIKRIINKFENVRKKGEDIKYKMIVAKKGDIITPQSVGVLAALGIEYVNVFLPPSVGIITTGDEIKPLNQKLNKYEIRNSNLVIIKSLLKYYLRIDPLFEVSFNDTKNNLYSFLGRLNKLPDITIITGGVSAGKRDYVKAEIERFGVKKLFHKISQKPGKPMYVGIKKDKIFFALPGNPVSVYINFLNYILPSINKFMGRKEIFLPTAYAILANDNIKNESNKTLFLSSYYKNGMVKILDKQGSHMLFGFSKSNSIVRLNPSEEYKKGDKLLITLLECF